MLTRCLYRQLQMSRLDRSRRAQRGFGLLEAVVALTLLASAGVALFGWINGSLATASRLRMHEQMQVQRQIASAWLQTVDPWREPQGVIEPSPGWMLRWEARPLSDTIVLPRWGGGAQSAWESRLFEVQAELSAEGATQHFVLSRLAVRRTVPFSIPSPTGAPEQSVFVSR